MNQARLWLFKISNSLASYFTRRVKYILFMSFLIGVAIIFTIIYVGSVYEDLLFIITSTYFGDIIQIVLVISATFVLNIAFAGIFVLLFEIATDEVFGRILQSTYLRAIGNNYYRMIRYMNIGKMHGLLSRWHKNLHEMLTTHIGVVCLYLFITIFIMSLYIADIISPYISESIPRNLLWDALLWSVGLLITILFFFIRYTSDRMNIEYTLRHFPYLLIAVLSFSISTVFAAGLLTLLNNSPEESLIAMVFTYVLLSILTLFVIFLRIISLPFTDGLKKIQKRAAKRDIYKYASDEAQLNIAGNIIKDSAYNESVGDSDIIQLSGKDLGFNQERTITDVNKSLPKYVVQKNDTDISSIQIQRSIGDGIVPSEPLIYLVTSSEIKQETIDMLSSAFKTRDFNPAEYRVYNNLERHTYFEHYIIEMEKRCKDEIDRGNITQINEFLHSYLDIAIVIGYQRRAYQQENITLEEPSELLANSITAIFAYYYDSLNSNFENRRDDRLLAELAYTTYRLYDYSEESMVNEDVQHFADLFKTITQKFDDIAMFGYHDIPHMRREMNIK